MIKNLGYRPYRPSGYTDDLGIMADRNQWIPEQIPGWYVMITHSQREALDWLEENGTKFDYMEGNPSILIFRNKGDVIEMILTWSEHE